MKKIVAAILNLGVNGTRSTLVAGALSNCQFRSKRTKELRSLDLASVTQCSERLQTKINSNFTVSDRLTHLNFDMEADIPAATRILDERSSPGIWGDRTTLVAEEAVSVTEIGDGISFDLSALFLKGNPAKGALRAEAGSKARHTSRIIATRCKLTANLLDGLLVNAKFSASAFALRYEIEVAWPFALWCSCNIAILNIALIRDTPVEDLVDCPCVTGERLSRGPIFDTVFISQYHRFLPKSELHRTAVAVLPDEGLGSDDVNEESHGATNGKKSGK